jgi:hypothetical protein
MTASKEVIMTANDTLIDHQMKNLPLGEDRNHQRPWGQAMDDELISLLANDQEGLARLQRRVDELKIELLTRMHERGGETIPSESYICARRVTSTYDQGLLGALKETFLEHELKECYVPAYEETIRVPESWSTVKVKAFAKDHGHEALAIVERARIPGRPTLLLRKRQSLK